MLTELLQFTDTFFSSPKKEAILQGNPIEDWKKLAHSGFNVDLQVQKLATDYLSGIQNGQDREELLKTWLDQTDQDIRGFIAEYLRKSLVLPNPVEYGEVDGVERVKGVRYGDRPLLEAISKQERFGAVFNNLESIEEFLLKKKPGSMALFTSPLGWSGFVHDGRDINYLESQTYCFRVNESLKLQSFNFVTDMDFAQNKKFLERFGLKEEDFTDSLDEKECLAELTGKIVSLDKANFEDVVDALEKAKDSPYAYKDKTFKEMKQILARGEELLNIDENTQRLIDEFKGFILGAPEKLSSEYIELVGERLSKLILEISSLIRGNKSLKEVKSMSSADYQSAYVDMSSISGCNGGGGIDNGLGYRGISFEGGAVCRKIRCGNRWCNWEASDEDIKRIQRRQLICCPKCSWKPS